MNGVAAAVEPPLAGSPLPRLTLVLGGARSGKSRYAETLAGCARDAVYLATAESRDAEMAERIRRHRARRAAQAAPAWETVEEPLDLAGRLLALARPGRPILVDCLTLWLTNVMLAGRDAAAAWQELAAALPRLAGPTILVANEVGLGIVPENALARTFRDAAGELNQAVAALADRVVFVAAGLPLVMKGADSVAAAAPPSLTLPRPSLTLPRKGGGDILSESSAYAPSPLAGEGRGWGARRAGSRRMTKKIPATIVTGFLGAGKTSLLRHLLGHAGGRRIALVINEFGELGIDRELLLGCGLEGCGEEDLIELANGCICCTVAEDFLPTLQGILERPEPPEHIVIETSGLALPKPLVQAFNWPEVKSRVSVDGVVTVIDAAAVAAGRFADDPEALAAQRAADPALDHDNPLEEVFADQLACADLVILSKGDLLDAARRDATRREIAARLRPAVKLVEAEHGKIAPEILLGLGAAAEEDLASRPSHIDTAGEHDHDDFESFVVERGPVADMARFLRRLAAAAAAHDILRLKGFLAVPGKEMRQIVQGVGTRFEHYFDRPWGAGEARSSRLVVIGRKGIDRAAIAGALRD